jgi:flagellar motor switch protein FliN/FliY
MNESNEQVEQTVSADQTTFEPATDTVGAGPVASAPSAPQASALLLGVKLPIRILLGRTQLTLRDVAQLGSGSVVELDCSPDGPVELMVNDKVIAHGEVVVVGGNYGVRITQISGGSTDPDAPEPHSDLLNLSDRLRG